MHRRAFVVLASLLLLAPVALAAQAEPVVVYVVRHAERADDVPNPGFSMGDTSDPPLSESGHARAQLIAEMLEDAGVTQVHSTDYVRTRSTGEATAEAAGLEIESYDPRNLPAFAARLRTLPGRHLVLGHSNTTPQMVEALGGDPGTAIEPMEYDRFYIVTIARGTVSTVLLRFGEPFEG
jgi:phosphohistidine phosphatase SixA